MTTSFRRVVRGRGPWDAHIEIEASFRSASEVRDLARMLRIDAHRASGHLIAMWLWCAAYYPETAGPIDESHLAFGAEWPKRSAQRWVDALEQCGFIERKDDGAYLVGWPGERGIHPVRAAWQALAKKLRPLIFERDGHSCVYCGDRDGPLEVDHIIPIARGGTNDIENLQTLCRTCNRSKGAS